MNVEYLRKFVAYLQAAEKEFLLQAKLGELTDSLTSLVNQQMQAQFQSEVAQRVTALEAALGTFYSRLTPAQKEHLREIGGEEYFSPRIIEVIKRLSADNPMTPIVVKDHAVQLRGSRDAYIKALEGMIAGLDAIGVGASDGPLALGFTIPRSLSGNNLGGLIDELQEIKRAVKRISEAATGKPEDPSVDEISTSDPIFFLLVTGVVLKVILHLFKDLNGILESIADLRDTVARLTNQGFSEKMVKDATAMIDKKVDEAVDKKVKDLLLNSKLDEHRKAELATGLRMTVFNLLARTERGLTVEVRLPLKDQTKTAEGSGISQVDFDEVKSLALTLKFAPPAADPVLQLPKSPKNIDETGADLDAIEKADPKPRKRRPKQ